MAKTKRHRWVKLRIHVYICRDCGMGKVNVEPDSNAADWRTTYHFPDGTSRIETHVPPCVPGPRTADYLKKYEGQIAEWKGHRHAIGKPDGEKAEGAKF